MEILKAEEYILDYLQKNLPATLYYHTIDHTKDVLRSSVALAKTERINGDELTLLKTAALFHDSGFTERTRNNEVIGCDIAQKALINFGYNHEQIEIICGMIMATKIPQTCNSHLQEIICDADLDYLGRDDFWELSEKLYKELNEEKKLNKITWHWTQASFLRKHNYFTDSAKKLRNGLKQKHLKEIEALLSNLTNNSINYF